MTNSTRASTPPDAAKWDCAVGTPDEDHEWEFCDDSFDHEYGCEQIHYWRCKHCGKERDMEPGDYSDD